MVTIYSFNEDGVEHGGVDIHVACIEHVDSARGRWVAYPDRDGAYMLCRHDRFGRFWHAQEWSEANAMLWLVKGGD